MSNERKDGDAHPGAIADEWAAALAEQQQDSEVATEVVPAERRGEVLKRGARLDETAPGSGLGLAIVDELSRAYGGEVTLGDAALGGLKVAVKLPRAET